MRLMGVAALVLAFLATDASAQAVERTPVEVEARAMFERMIAFPTVAGRAAVLPMADYLAAQARAAGFDAADVEIERVGETAGLIVRYRGAPGSTHAPVLFLAHMDVVDAARADWDRDPWALSEVDGVFYGRGVVDNKYGVLTILHPFMRLKREGFTPDRDLVIAFSGDEETTQLTTRLLSERLSGAAFAINADAGGGWRPANGGPGVYALQVAEKTYATFEITATNSGGHSSAPRPDNAIYQLARSLEPISRHRFPVRWNAATLAGFGAMAPTLEGDLGQAVMRFVEAPGDPAAVAVMERESWIDRDLRTTCVATMLRAGHAENALPTRATATVNCRIFPGETVESVRLELQRLIADETLAVATLGEPLESPVSDVPPELTAALDAVLDVRSPGAAVSPYMEAGGTDGLHFRRAGIPTVGAGALMSGEGVEYNYHGNNERMPVSEFYDGLDHFYLLIKALAGGAQAAP